MKLQRWVKPFPPRPLVQRQPWADLRVPILVGTAVLLLTSSLGQRFYNIPRLDAGKIAPATIMAPANATITDEPATEAKRKEARNQSPLMLRRDQTKTLAVQDRLQAQIGQGNTLRQTAGAFPYAPSDRLSLASQAYLRRATPAVWQTIEREISQVSATSAAKPAPPLATVAPKSQSNSKSRVKSQNESNAKLNAKSNAKIDSKISYKIDSKSTSKLNVKSDKSNQDHAINLNHQLHDQVHDTAAPKQDDVPNGGSQAGTPPVPSPNATPAATPTMTNSAIADTTLKELQQYRRTSSAAEFATLWQTIVQMRSRYPTALQSLASVTLTAPTPTLEKPGLEPPLFDTNFLDFTEADWQQTQKQILLISTRMLAQGIPPGLPTTVLPEAINLQTHDIPASTQAWAAQLLRLSLQPNLVNDEQQTLRQQDRAAEEVQPVQISIRQGDTIVTAGQAISPAAFALLDHFQLSQRAVDGWGLAGFGSLVTAAIALYWRLERWFQPKLRRRDRILILLLLLTTPLLLVLRVPSTNLPAIGILVGSFYGSPLGLTVTGLLAALLPIGLELPLKYWVPSTAAGLLCGVMAGRLRTREELALLGTAAGLLQGGLYLVVGVATGGIWYALLGDAAIHGLLGLAWSIVAIGISPYLEQVFDLVTTVRLVELANPNRPLLKRLAADAPGTFQHTLLVATLAEAAARALGCNVELVRTGTLYHDIGKMHDPLGFIENQMGGPNKHDAINDPWKSADIIKKHVTEGIVMARRARLPKAVQAFIPEHQGTMLVSYFYHQAQQRSQQSLATAVPDSAAKDTGAKDSDAKDAGAIIVQEADFRYAGPDPQSRETGIVMVADACEAALRSLKEATPDTALNMINKILRARWQEGQLANSGLTRADMDTIAQVFVQTWQQFNHQRIAYPKLAAQPVAGASE